MNNGFDPVSYIMGAYASGGAHGSAVQFATDSIDTTDTTVTIAYSGTIISAYAIQDGELIQCNIVIGSSSVVFTLGDKPTEAVTCVVVYK